MKAIFYCRMGVLHRVTPNAGNARVLAGGWAPGRTILPMPPPPPPPPPPEPEPPAEEPPA